MSSASNRCSEFPFHMQTHFAQLKSQCWHHFIYYPHKVSTSFDPMACLSPSLFVAARYHVWSRATRIVGYFGCFPKLQSLLWALETPV